MRVGIYTVRELRDNIVAIGLRFCLHKVVAKNRGQFATFFLTSTVVALWCPFPCASLLFTRM